MLRDVAYVVHADIELRAHASDPVAKYRDQFRRRIERGTCFSRPYLGLQEFHAEFRAATNDDQPDPALTMPVGSLPLDLQFAALTEPASTETIDPVFWPAMIERGVLQVPRVEQGHDAAR